MRQGVKSYFASIRLKAVGPHPGFHLSLLKANPSRTDQGVHLMQDVAILVDREYAAT